MDSKYIDFGSIVEERVALPYRDEPYLRLSFSDPVLHGYEVTVIADTKNPRFSGAPDEGTRLVTIIGRFPRIILPEVNTHRVISKNSASSRARSVRSEIASVVHDPYIPLFTQNMKGMSGEFVDENRRAEAVSVWLRKRDGAVSDELELLMGRMHSNYPVAEWESLVEEYYDRVYNAEVPDPAALNVHKQNANRLLEPFMWHESVLTSSMWKNFIHLRTNLDTAQPEIFAFALLVERALKVSEPAGTWIHLPFAQVVPERTATFEELRGDLMLSATNCAQISYRDKSRAVRSTATFSLGERLLSSEHLSPFEHVAFDTLAYAQFEDEGIPRSVDALASNLGSNWVQLRHVLAH